MSGLQLVDDDSAQQIAEFLNYLYEGLEGYAYAPTLERNEEGKTTNFEQQWFLWPTEAPQMADWILARQSEKDVYVAPAIFKEKVLSKNSFKASNVAWTEFDGNVPDLNGLGDIPAPTLRVQSSESGFEHWYWKLTAPSTIATELEAINRGITYTLGADASSWDCTQILRPVNTTNHKRNSTVRLLEKQSGAVTSAIFEPVHIDEQAPTFEFESIPDVSEVIFKYAMEPDLISLFRTKEFPVGSRSSALMRLGYSLAEHGMNDAEIFSVLRNADDRWKKFAGRTDRDRRLVDLITKVRLKHPATVITEDVIPLLGFQSFLDSEVEIEWLIPGLLQSTGYFLLTGPAGVGKTQWSIQWAIHLALGKPYLGFVIERPMRILLWSLEMDHADLKFFVSSMAASLTAEECATLESNLIIAPLGEPFYIDNEKGQKRFEQVLDVVRPDVFMWDSIGSATSAELSSESTVKSLMDFNDRIRKRHGVASWFIHHNRKATSDNKKPNKQSDVYGNQYLVNRATTIYCLWPNHTNIEVIPLKKRLAPLEKPWHITRNEHDLSFTKKEDVSAITGGGASVQLIENPPITDEDLGESKPGMGEF